MTAPQHPVILSAAKDPRLPFDARIQPETSPWATYRPQLIGSIPRAFIIIQTRSFSSLMFKSFDVWKELAPERIVRYRCFEDSSTGKFCVQSADFYNLPFQTERLIQLEKQFLELVIEESPFTRSGAFDTVEEAIASHNSEFLDDR
jgi:hypothetical protein